MPSESMLHRALVHPEHPSLARTLSLRIAGIAILTTLFQLAVVIAHNYFDYAQLEIDHVSHEAHVLSKGIKWEAAGPAFVLPSDASYYADSSMKGAYGFRILNADGRVIHEENAAQIVALSPWQRDAAAAQDMWVKRFDPEKRFHFAGGYRLRVGQADLLIEIITHGDPAGIYWQVIGYETWDDALYPILPFALLLPVVTLGSVRQAMRPVERAAKQATNMDPRSTLQALNFDGMPREVAAFSAAINGLLDRVRTLIEAQRLFIASAAHELRTPLAVMLLELENIDHPRAQLLRSDVAAMSENVERLLVLARLETQQSPDVSNVDMGAIAEEIVSRLRGWARARNHTIEVLLDQPGQVQGDRFAIREAIRNLIDNAIRHTPAGSTVRVTVGPAGQVTIEDDGPGLQGDHHLTDELFQPFRKADASSDGAGLGLAIVRQAIELHRGSIDVGRSQLGGAMFRLQFA